jgi:hypothetical protein
MQPTKYLIGLVLFLSIAVSCNKKLDVQPQNSLTSDLIKTSDDVKALLFGAYNGMQGPGAFGEGYIFTPDLIAPDSQINFYGTFQDYQQVYNKKALNTNVISQNVWGGSYNIIGLCNTILDKIALVDSNDQAEVGAEAQFIRGVAYFELVGLFAKPYADGSAATNLGVPLILKPTYTYTPSDPATKPARSTVDQTYTQIIADLQAAISNLPTSNDNFRADVFSARAILSRVYMSMGRYADAAAQADSVIGSGNFSLTPTFDKTFNTDGNSTEDVFAIQQSTQSNAGTVDNGLATFYSPQYLGRGDAMIDPNFYSIFDDPNDFRSTFVTSGFGISHNVGDFTNKWAEFYKAIPVVRLSEMYLTRGEANLLAGGGTGDDPLLDINTVRERAGAQDLLTVSPTDFVEERFRELTFEGDRFWTLKRLKLNIGAYGYDDDKLILPIPRTEIQTNSNLVQNNGY